MKKKNFFSYLLSLFGEKKRIKSAEFQLSSESVEELKNRLHLHMVINKPYLRNGFHMKELADDLQIPVYQLSAFLNKVIGMRFTDYINQFRIAYCKDLLRNDLNTKPNLEELAYKCGFNNRNSFTAAFKKFTGLKPSAYLKGLLILGILLII